MDGGGTSWGIITILGPLLLLAVLAWAALRNRGRAKGGVTPEETERATKDLYRREDAAHRHDGDGAP